MATKEVADGKIERRKSGLVRGDQSSFGEVYVGILKLFVPNFINRLAWIGMKMTDTALLGHSGTDFLTASSLSDFWTSIWSIFISDTVLGSLCGQAYGAENYEKVGTWLQVSCTVFGWILIPVFVLNVVTGPALHYGMGTDQTIAGYAGYYAIVLAFCLPARFVSGKLQTFFSSQKITEPSWQTTPVALFLNLLFGLQLVLGIPYAAVKFGFWACPIVTTSVEWFIVLVLFVYYCGVRRLHEKCWPPSVRAWNPLRDIYVAPWSASPDSQRFAYFNKMIKPNLYEFARLALPASLALGSDFWRMSAIGLYSSTLGDKAVAVFNSSYRVAWLNIVVVGSFSQACATQLSIALGTGDGQLSARVRNIGIFTVLTFLILTVGASVVFIEELAMIFSTDPEVIQMYCDTKWQMAGMIFFMCFAMHFESLLSAMKKTDLIFRCSMAGSWLGQVPAVVILTTFYGHGLYNVYLGVAVGYALLACLNIVGFFLQDLDEAAKVAYETNKQKEPLLKEENEGDACHQK